MKIIKKVFKMYYNIVPVMLVMFVLNVLVYRFAVNTEDEHKLFINNKPITQYDRRRCDIKINYVDNIYMLNCPDRDVSNKFISIREDNSGIYITK